MIINLDSGEEAANPLLANEKIEIDSGRGTSIGAEVGDNTTTFSEVHVIYTCYKTHN